MICLAKFCSDSVSFSTTMPSVTGVVQAGPGSAVGQHGAKPARAKRFQARLVAETRNVDTGRIGRFDDFLARLGLDLDPINFNVMVWDMTDNTFL